ncbi:MAG: translational machinery protein [Variovorax sp.]
MSQSSHAVVWMDHAEAHILHYTSEDVQNRLRGKPLQRRHHKRAQPDPTRAPMDQAYFTEIAGSLADATEILVTGPANAKSAFVRHLNEHSHDVRKKIVAIETVDHPSNVQLLDYARKHFRSRAGMG